MGLNEPLCKTRRPGAGIIRISMHRFVFTHDRCCCCLSGAEQGWSSRLANGQIYQLHTLCLRLSAFRPDNLEHILAILAQSRSAHGFSLLTDTGMTMTRAPDAARRACLAETPRQTGGAIAVRSTKPGLAARLAPERAARIRRPWRVYSRRNHAYR